MNITILTIEHKHGTNVYPCATPEIADAYLYEYVGQYWDEVRDYSGDDELEMPENADEAIELYFETVEGESYAFTTELLLETLPKEGIMI